LIIWSNPIAEHLLDEVRLTADERGTVEKRMEQLHRQQTEGKGSLTLPHRSTSASAQK